MNTLPLALSPEDRRLLEWARRQLEQPPFAIRLAQVVGAPLQATLRLLPTAWHRQLQRVTEFCIRQALTLAIVDLNRVSKTQSWTRNYKQAVVLTGAVAGFFGGTVLWVELPITTVLMLKSIAEIARRQGEDLNSPETRLACVEVFALGGGTATDYAADTGYYGLRLGLEFSKADLLKSLVESGFKIRGSPALSEWVMGIARRFGLTVSEKAAVQLAPVVGAVGGATLNAAFIQHFQKVARGHFTMRRLERKYGREFIQGAYEQLTRPIEVTEFTRH